MSIDGLNLSALVTELKKAITGSRIDKIVQLDKYTLLFGLYQNGHSYKLVISANPEQAGLYLTEENFESPLQPPGFCMLLRKHLEDGRIGLISQQELDRVVYIDIDTLGAQGMIVTKRLVIEIMGKHSNLILVKDQVIMDALRRVGKNLSRVRQILPGETYMAPPGQQKINLLTDDLTVFWQEFANLTEMTAEKAIINLAFGLGPQSVREWLREAGLPPKITVQELDAADLASLQDVISRYIAAFQKAEFLPTVCTTVENKVASITAFPPELLPETVTPHSFPTMSRAIEYIHQLRPVRLFPERDVLVKQVTGELHKCSRKLEKLTDELAVSQDAAKLKEQGDLLMAYLDQIQPHSKEVTLENFYEPGTSLTIALAPEHSALENAQTFYHAYHKQKRAQGQLAEQIETCKSELAYLETVQFSLQQVDKNSEFAEIRQELVSTGYLKPLGRRQALPPAKPFTLPLSGGGRILIGKNNKQNDHLTFKIAKPNDLWFHTKDIPGSHVILQTEGQPSVASIEQAAGLAAYFSKAKNSSKVPVDYTKRRYVKKPSGSKPGFVIYEKQTTLQVEPDAKTAEGLQKSGK